MSIFVASLVTFRHESCHISQNHNRRECARGARYIDFVYRTKLFLSCLCYARGASNLDESRIALPSRRRRASKYPARTNDARPSGDFNVRLINRNVLVWRVVTINRRRNVALINRKQVTRIAHYYSRINVFHRYNVY